MNKKLHIEYNQYSNGGDPINPEEKWTSYTDQKVSQ